MRKYPLLAVFTLGALLAPAQTVRQAPPGVEEALRARVDQFYTYFRDAKFRRAEGLVAEESKDTFYTMSKSPISGFKVESVDFDDSFQSAKVRVLCESNTPRTSGMGMYIPVTGKWKLLEGDWYLVIEPRTTTPFGPTVKRESQELRRTARLEPKGAATLEALKGAFSVEPQKLVFPLRGDPVTQTVTVKNSLPGDLKMEIEGSDLPGMQLDFSDNRLPAKSDIAIQFKYDPKKGELRGTRQIRIHVQPLNQTKIILLQFE